MRFLPSTTLRWLSVPAVVGLLNLASTPAGAQWTQTTSLPARYAEHTLVYSSGFLYQAGGVSYELGTDAVSVLYAQVHSNGTVGTWNAATPLPEAVYDHAGVAANGFLYVLGGVHYTPASGDVLSDTVYYSKINPDGSLGAWQTANHLPYAPQFCSATAWNGRIYVIGGWGSTGPTVGGFTNAVYSAAIQTNGSLSSWVAQTPLPNATSSHTSVANGFLYVISGLIAGGSQITSNVYCSKINGDGTLAGWIQTTPLPYAVANFGGVAANGRIFTMGGWNGSSPVSVFSSATVNGDGSLGAWSAGIPMPQPLYYHAVAASDSHIFVSGRRQHSNHSEQCLLHAVASATHHTRSHVARHRNEWKLSTPARLGHEHGLWLSGLDESGGLGAHRLGFHRHERFAFLRGHERRQFPPPLLPRLLAVALSRAPDYFQAVMNDFTQTRWFPIALLSCSNVFMTFAGCAV